MDFECIPLSWELYHQYEEEGLEALRHSLLYTTLELKASLVSAKEEITRKECELIQLTDLLNKVITERDEAQEKWQKLMSENLMLRKEQALQPPEEITVLQNEVDELKDINNSNNSVASDCDESNVASSSKWLTEKSLSSLLEEATALEGKKPLPEKGKLLEAVVEAGPLLQTLLLAGPLPQWQHPPPQINSIEIPPVSISSPTPCILRQNSSTSPCFNQQNQVELAEGLEGMYCSSKAVYQNLSLH